MMQVSKTSPRKHKWLYYGIILCFCCCSQKSSLRRCSSAQMLPTIFAHFTSEGMAQYGGNNLWRNWTDWVQQTNKHLASCIEQFQFTPEIIFLFACVRSSWSIQSSPLLLGIWILNRPLSDYFLIVQQLTIWQFSYEGETPNNKDVPQEVPQLLPIVLNLNIISYFESINTAISSNKPMQLKLALE